MKSRKREFCDCGQPAFKLVRNEPVCRRCAELERISWHAEVRPSVGPFDPILASYRVGGPEKEKEE